MLRSLDFMLIAIMAGMAAVTYSVRHQTDQKVDKVHELETKIKQEKDTIDLLKADWALLTQPTRLEALANTYVDQLHLEQTKPEQIVQPNELPRIREDAPQTAEGEKSPVDAIATGSVKR
ncbi:hypothetical protein [Rhizobium sp. NRK18]|jgi:hypothetical protein|uniref:cell division protein FtsL n=1 Tax=Rhizobium sp. NRK18 TaxID=2964667 RepID=UPI0021C369A1|nr:hypothetical protein [Rhizobium sp. NRK18]MCQ2003749.1 hypothetical protein [Rhizobium sp. NRK18]